MLQSKPQCLLASRLEKGLLKQLFSPEAGKNGDANHSIPKSGLGSRQPACARARNDFSNPHAVAIETVAAQSNCGDRELSSATMWNRNVYDRPLQRDLGGVRNRSAAGAAGRRHRA